MIDGRQRLYDLLPESVRFRDQESGRPLEALMGVLDLEYRRLAVGMGRLYDDWFIETCQPWLVPLIGDLVGLEGLERREIAGYSWRPMVAKAIARRRYKGTVTCLERTAADATGWGAFAVAGAASLAFAQDVRAPRPAAGGFIDLQDPLAVERVATPFGRSSHTVDIRTHPEAGRVDSDGSLHHPSWVTVWLWRIAARPVWRGAPRRVAAGCYTFDPFGLDVPLYVQPTAPTGERRPAGEAELPLPLTTAALGHLLDELRDTERAGQLARTPVRDWLQIFDVAAGRPVPLRAMAAWDLEDWRRPGPDDVYCRRDRLGAEVRSPVLAAVDPERGRFTLAEASPRSMLVDYSYGRACDLGGGPHRPGRRRLDASPGETWRALVVADSEGGPSGRSPGSGLGSSPDLAGPPVFRSLEDALAAWPENRPEGHLRILGSGRLDAPGLWSVDLTRRHGLVIEAAEDGRPYLVGDLQVNGLRVDQTDRLDLRQPTLRLTGLWLDGSIAVAGGLELRLEDSTLGPPLRSAAGRGDDGPVEETRPRGALRACGRLLARVVVETSILGPIRLPPSGVVCEIRDSVIDGALWQGRGAAAVAYGGAPGSAEAEVGPTLLIERSTVLGELAAQSLGALDTFFTRRPHVERLGTGSLRHCFVPPPPPSREAVAPLPPQSHGLPPESPEACRPAPGWGAADQSEGWLVSIVYGDPGYAQTSATAPVALMTGGSEDSAIGVLHRLHEADRLGRLPAVFEETVRSDMQAQAVLVDGATPRRLFRRPARKQTP